MPMEIAVRKPPSERRVSDAALDLIADFEGFRADAYLCPAGIPTIGFGFTTGVKLGDTITLDDAVRRLRHEVEAHANIIRAKVKVPLTQGEFDALASLVFNLGKIPASLLACLNGGLTDKGETKAPGSYSDAIEQFPRSCRANGKPLFGLYRRRLAEALMFAGLPWRHAADIKNVIWKTTTIKTSNGEVEIPDVSVTTSLHDAILLARQTPEFARLPDLQEVSPEPEPTPEPEPEPVAAPPAPPLVFGTKPKSINTRPPAEVPYKIDPDGGLKPLEESSRAHGFVWQSIGLMVLRIASLGTLGTFGLTISDMVRGDPVLMQAMLGLFVMAGLGATGAVVKLYGDWKRKRGEEAATQGLY